ncbi:FHA domain-containing protein [Curtobacterium sp. MCSS17_007]|uniref:FHA domain-containing protein n=1 Tax=Curtobacterium sp. MCSS17_007 TaxID=2175646 RepID=UPI000DA9E16F|nr:FHA domain-containing protein [Curtobacterium sp. MCSS17_007]WIE74345.1 FHA domain-containing protein [Curtobacterium sp. MCSS17_007]
MTMEAEPVREDDVDDTVVRPRPVPHRDDDRSAPGPDDTVVRPRTSVSVDGDPFGDTVIRPRARTAPTLDTVAADASGDTVVRGASVGPVPAAPAPTVGTARARVPSIRLGGRVLRLDRPVVVGRRPASPRVVTGAEPLLIAVSSPNGEVSSSHLLVHAEGEAAVVDDLRSTNGTVVRPPGAAPFRMASGASVVVLTGTVVEIGDGNVIEFLSPHLRVGPDDVLPPFPSVP